MAISCNNLHPILFVVDTNLLASHKDFNSLIKNVNDELSTIEKWFQLIKLALNVKKCNFMIFFNINKYYPKEQAKIYINNAGTELVQQTKVLGVHIDSGLKWSNHIDLVSKDLPSCWAY